ncbi:efflux RND transporter permease subunit [Allorhodopirellula heiligendammensis]|uniref:Multidrug resistance protein MdtB n=1 Tax=Allorhodopirellula heiligendammensis TaxID=2714739 RepID=A0A5C6CB15_9BACT|nr:efflux RND transporter permease subunit [Allorhodopirellula heiligendammensis]TWU20009.1 Multidrug resistance protein MdtB [Allorhodopirellula heiligendammensis]
MRRVLSWAIHNAPGMNVVMLALVAIGAASFWSMRREVFPEFELEVVMIKVPYPGATPQDTEEAICQKIEESIRSINGIKKVTSIAMEGSGYVLAELRSDVGDVQKVMAEIDREVDRIPSFPDLAEDASVEQITFRETAIRVGIIGPEDRTHHGELALRDVAERIRAEMLLLPSVTVAELMGTRPYQIDVEIPEETLRSYGLTLDQVAAIIRSRNIELPGGQLKSSGQEILLRAKNKGRIGSEIEKLPLVTQPGGVVLTVADLGVVRDEFEDVTATGEINGEPAMVINVQRTKSEDLLALVDDVRGYAATAELPPGYRMVLWGDTSVDVRDRISLLMRNGAQGLTLVFLVLAFFLEVRLAFWVALGIPISIMGAGAALVYGGQTLNMLSLFSFLIALGIVVDDAIVIGENIYAHRQMGKTLMDASVDGATEVLPSVAASIATTVLAFAPMFFVSGVMGKFMAVIPFAVIAMLVISLWESTFVLPCHLAHSHNGFFRAMGILAYPLRPFTLLLFWCNRHASDAMEWFARNIYVPILHFCLRNPVLPIAVAIGMLVGTMGMVRGGIVKSVLFPKTDNNYLQATVVFPNGTPASATDRATRRMEEALARVNNQIAAERAATEKRPLEEIYPVDEGTYLGPVRLAYREVGTITNTQGPMGGQGGTGSNSGQIFAELHGPEIRNIRSEDLINRWRHEVGEIPGIEKITFGSVGTGPGGKPIEFKLLASSDHVDELLAATETMKERVAKFAGVYDISDDNTPGKWEFQFRVKDSALSTGVTPTDLGQTVRNTYYGAEVMRLQRGRHEVKLMVRYPQEQRASLVNFREIQVSDKMGTLRPIGELAEIDLQRGFSEINRVDQQRSIMISADLDEITANADLIIRELKEDYLPEFARMYPNVSIRWEGQQEQSRESVGSLIVGFSVAILCMFVLLVLQFRSYAQPLLILAIVPFGMIGAVWGHGLLGLPLTLFSMFGLVALAGVVVNDSIVLIDFINTRVRAGESPLESLLQAGERRFRPIMLTSMTTIAGLLPLLFEKSFQAQLLIPMAASLAFGLMLSTVLVLLLIPVLYLLYLLMLQSFGISFVEVEE